MTTKILATPEFYVVAWSNLPSRLRRGTVRTRHIAIEQEHGCRAPLCAVGITDPASVTARDTRLQYMTCARCEKIWKRTAPETPTYSTPQEAAEAADKEDGKLVGIACHGPTWHDGSCTHQDRPAAGMARVRVLLDVLVPNESAFKPGVSDSKFAEGYALGMLTASSVEQVMSERFRGSRIVEVLNAQSL